MMAKNKKISAALMNNLNAEKYTEEKAIEIFQEALKKSKEKDYDFVGEVAMDMDVNRHLFTELANKFPNLKPLHSQMISNLEANCFRHTKKNDINTAVGIINLKSNHGWTDRQETTSQQTIKIENLPDELNELLDDGE